MTTTPSPDPAQSEKARHTPGPWTASEYYVNSTDHGWVARCNVPEEQHARACANARLIAAAPDLLSACMNLIGTLHETESRCYFGVKFAPKNNPCDCNQHAAYNESRAAIVRAGGAA